MDLPISDLEIALSASRSGEHLPTKGRLRLLPKQALLVTQTWLVVHGILTQARLVTDRLVATRRVNTTHWRLLSNHVARGLGMQFVEYPVGFWSRLLVHMSVGASTSRFNDHIER